MRLLFLLKEGIAGFKRARLAATISIATITLSLSLIGMFALLVHHLSAQFQQTYGRIQLEVFIDPAIDSAQRQALEGRMQQLAAVEAVQYVSPEMALQRFQQDFGDDLLTVLEGENPFPPSLQVILKKEYAELEKVEAAVEAIRALPQVDEVIFQEKFIRLINRYFFIGLIVATTIGATIFFISTMLIFNTIRLTIHSRKTVIEIMRLVGATHFFIKAPFVIEGLLQGLIGSLLASGALWLMSDLLRAFFLPGLTIPWMYFLFLCGTGILLGLLGSYFSIGKYLKF